MKQTLNSHPEEEPNREIAALMESERPHLLQYACYRLGNVDDAEDAVQDIFLQLHTKRQDAGGQPALRWEPRGAQKWGIRPGHPDGDEEPQQLPERGQGHRV